MRLIKVTMTVLLVAADDDDEFDTVESARDAIHQESRDSDPKWEEITPDDVRETMPEWLDVDPWYTDAVANDLPQLSTRKVLEAMEKEAGKP
jgi:hypothetical protein